MAEKKKKKINWLYVIIPVLAVIILASMLGRLFGPSTVCLLYTSDAADE